MNYVKSCLIITMLLGVGYSQCDANGDGDLDVLDVVIEVDCILTDCWEGVAEIAGGIYGDPCHRRNQLTNHTTVVSLLMPRQPRPTSRVQVRL